MEQWKISVLTGVALIILALLFSAVRGTISIWMALVIILGVADIAIGLYRKSKE
ncbi:MULTISPECIES: hypothetical protein [Methanobrevibacter]|jgi:uncharacterized membrane protein|uniref:Uncharacterized protein n=1 Tax=Methanobrevibacter thaueri TaxID=190975 RepID=A0A315XKN1_9EURY|nr:MULTISPECIES: hypothetical protein [Methanobrevibacter]MBR2665134.1 hypothetical protein [Methanobrevibacter sp.]MBR6928066.1 hypothetical protein [Methanobrevibacter sp.]MBR7049880.1 hypothetical protein [Methanobrevibacter sp.]PWB85361.1 hypothetical protein MBBTH_19600 [Methanobrevibacter thaueri]